MSELLTVSNLHVSFHTKGRTIYAVRGISLSLAKGEVLAIVGESGCGKSVTAKTMVGLNTMSAGKKIEGSILLEGRDLCLLSEKAMTEVRGNVVSMIFQDPMSSLNPTMRIGIQLTEMLRFRKRLSFKQSQEEAVKLLKMVHIPEPELRIHQYPHQLSGGMLQRVMIAMALACGPKLLIADEPTTALDVTIQKEILKLLASLRHEFGMSMILITHDLSVAANVADRIAVMYAGKILESGAVRDVFTQSIHPYTSALLQSHPSLNTVDGEELHTIPGSPPDLSHLISGCPFAPRCSRCTEICKRSMPKEITVSPGHSVSCFLVEHGGI